MSVDLILHGKKKGKKMVETYLWQQVGNQGYNKYGKGIVGPGSKEALDRAVNAHAGVPVGTKFPVTDPKLITEIEVLDKPTCFGNKWGGFGTDYKMKPGELRMTYGQQSIDYMDKRWQKLAAAKGKTTLLDQAGSVDVSLMESTHRDAKTGKYLTGQLRELGKKVKAVKDANIGVTIPTEDMTHVLTSEAAKVGGAPVKLRPGMVIAQDALGTYTPPLKTLLKKNKPVDKVGKAVFDKLNKFQHLQDLATDYAKKGFISEESSAKYINKAWKFVQKWAKAIVK